MGNDRLTPLFTTLTPPIFRHSAHLPFLIGGVSKRGSANMWVRTRIENLKRVQIFVFANLYIFIINLASPWSPIFSSLCHCFVSLLLSTI